MSLWPIPGKSIFLTVLLLPFSFTSIEAQLNEIKKTFPVNPFSSAGDAMIFNPPVEGTIDVIAVMVEFQPDDNRFTSGNGTFDPGAIPWLEEPGTNVDALPHDRQFFEGRLEFVSNYFARVSGGRLTIEYTVLPEIIRLEQPMEYYSPIGEDPDFEPLAWLARDTWAEVANRRLIDSEDIDPNTTAFIIFHAGIGRDIELTGTVLEKTPQDIPSIYLGHDALRELLDDPGFIGFDSGENDIHITNTIINPRTHTRRGTDVSGETFLLPLSANGMLTAQIGSHLGLPDLFDTETGQSGIGRFGLMDGAGIFGFNGLFPPEPSAWEKIHLGWASSFTVIKDMNEPVDLPAAYFRDPGSIARIHLSSDEYFLLENRHRDPLHEGVTLTIQRSDGSTVEQTFTNMDTGFDPVDREFDRLLEPGIIIDVSNYDWALPGGYDESNGRELNGGILIWHVDEYVIRNNIRENRINANPDHRGVELKEADGSQDIGRPTDVGLTDNNPNGWAFDFWWNGNNASVTTQTGTFTFYENRFAPDTKPPSRSHSGAPSFFKLYDFSDNLPVAQFKIDPFQDIELEISETKNVQLQGVYRTPVPNEHLKRYPYGIQHFRSGENDILLLPKTEGLTSLHILDGNVIIQELPSGVYGQPFAGEYLVLAENNPSGELSGWSWNSEQGEFFQIWNKAIDTFPGLISSLDGQVLDLDHTNRQFNISDGTELPEIPEFRQQTINLKGYSAELAGSEIRIHTPDGTRIVNSPVDAPDVNNRVYLTLVESTENSIDLLLFTENSLLLFDDDGNSSWISLIDHQNYNWPALVDFNRDGYLEIIYINSDSGILEAVNTNGAIPDFFPIIPPEGVRFTGTPLIADLNGDGSLEILVAGLDSGSMTIYAFNRRGNLVDPFPLLAGSLHEMGGEIVNPLLFESSLAAVSPSGELRVWNLPYMQDPLWPGRFGAHPWNKITGSVEPGVNPDLNFGLLNEDETYNWPNPARDETHLRFQLNQPGEVNIKIATLSGRLIYDRTVESSGGAPEEIRIDTSNWSSGGYYAVVTARSGNLEERKMVKIGVAR